MRLGTRPGPDVAVGAPALVPSGPTYVRKYDVSVPGDKRENDDDVRKRKRGGCY